MLGACGPCSVRFFDGLDLDCLPRPPALEDRVVPFAEVLRTEGSAGRPQAGADTGAFWGKSLPVSALTASRSAAASSAPAGVANPQVHMIVCALDYKKTRFPLTCTMDGNNMCDLAELCGAKVDRLYDEDATVANVTALVKRVGQRCKVGDYFVFYYAGHGANLPDTDGDEDDCLDEAFCFVDANGQTSSDCWLRDDDFAKLVQSSVHKDTSILILADCCHSGTVADLNKPIWDGYKVASMSGCKDPQTSGDTGKGGIFTHSLLLAIDALRVRGEAARTVGEVYTETLSVDDSVFASSQDITLQCKPNDQMLWPLVPAGAYAAPMRNTVLQKAVVPVAAPVAAAASPASGALLGSPQQRRGTAASPAAASPASSAARGSPQKRFSTPAATPTAAATPSAGAGTARAAGPRVVHMIVCALDYKKTRNPLTCTVDGDNMIELAKSCGANVDVLYNEDATIDKVSSLIRQVGSRCGPGDMFVFFYAGHGANLPDQDGDEDDGMDEAFCLVDANGQTAPSTWLRDDDFASLVTSSVHADTNILILSDCCHSGTVADLNKPCWAGYSAVSLSGCKDQQTSGDTGRGGIFTHSMLLAMDEFGARGQTSITVGELYTETLKFDHIVLRAKQDVSMSSAAANGESMLWPFVPPAGYVAPLKRVSRSLEPAAPSSPAAAASAPSLPTLLKGDRSPEVKAASSAAFNSEKQKGQRDLPGPEVVGKQGCGCFWRRPKAGGNQARASA